MAKGLTGIKTFPLDIVDEGDCKLASFQVVGAGAASPTVTLAAGALGDFVQSVTWNSTGNYTVTLRQACYKYLAIHADVLTSGVNHWHVTCIAQTPTSGTFQLKTFSAATTVAPALADLSANETLMVTLVMKQKSTSRLRA